MSDNPLGSSASILSGATVIPRILLLIRIHARFLVLVLGYENIGDDEVDTNINFNMNVNLDGLILDLSSRPL